MAASTTSSESLDRQTQLEDVLAYLPVATATGYHKGQTIYGPECVSNDLYLLLSGKVGVSRIAESGREVLLEVVRPDELFGESAFIGVPMQAERATAVEHASVMNWAVSDIEDLISKRPRLGIALLQIMAHRNIECNRRIESVSLDTIERRLGRALVRFAGRLGTAENDGSVRMPAFTHEALSRYVGTSREIITQYMNHFRRQGCVQYSRSSIILHCEALKAVVERTGLRSAAKDRYE